MSVDFTTCPYCGATPFRPVARERLYGDAGILLAVLPDGAAVADFGGSTEVDWNSSETMYYFCDDCNTALPDGYAWALRGLLYGKEG